MALALILLALGFVLANAALTGKPIADLLAGVANLKGTPKLGAGA